MSGATTLSVASALLKEIYEPPLQDQLQSEVLTLKRIEKSTQGISHEVGGKYVTFPIRVRRNHGIGARLENEALPDARSQKYVSVRVALKYLYGAISITGQTMNLAKTNPQAFVNAMDEEVKGLRESLVKDINRQVYGTNAGKLATIPTGSASAGLAHTVTSAQYLEEGMVVDIRTSAGVLVASKITIEDANQDTGVVTFDTSFDSTDGDFMTRHGSYNKEKTGFEQMVTNTGTLFEVDPTTVPLWKSHVESNSGTPRALSEGIMIKVADKIRTKGGKTTVIFTTLGVRRSYFALLQQQRQIVNTKKFDGGFEGLSFTTDAGEIPVMADFDCQKGRMYYINEKDIKLYQAGEWSFMNEDGSNWQRVMNSQGKFDAYEAMMFKYCEMGLHRRNTHALLSDLQEAE